MLVVGAFSVACKPLKQSFSPIENMEDLDLGFLVDDYILYLVGQGRQPETLKDKRHRLGIFLAWLGSRVGNPPGLADLTAGNYRAFVQYLQDDARYGQHHDHIGIRPDRHLAPLTVKGYAMVIKAFSHWLAQEGHYATDPLAQDKAPRVPKVQVLAFTDQEVDRLIAAIDWRFPAFGARQLAIVLFLLDTGVRLGELLDLTDDHLWLDDQRALVTGKGRKQRYVPFGVTCCRYLRKYITRYRPPPLGLSAYVFRADDGGQMSRSRIDQILKGLSKRSGVPDVHAHRFRHTFAYRYIRAGGDAFSLQRILGHATIVTTMVYVNMQTDDIARQHAQFSPVDHLRHLPRVR